MKIRPFIPKDYKTLTRQSVKRNRYRPKAAVATAIGPYRRPAWAQNRILFPALAIVGCLYLVATFLSNSGAPAHASMQRHAVVLPTPDFSKITLLPSIGEATQLEPVQTDEDDRWRTITVQKGQTLGAIFADLELTAADVHHVVHADEHTQKLTKIYPGDDLHFLLSDQGGLESLKYRLSETTTLRVDAATDGYQTHLLEDELVRGSTHASGTITDSLFLSGQRAGLSDRLIMELASLFGWDIDFVLDIRRGDQFHVVYERVYRNGEFIRNGEILAATFVNRGEKYQALRYEVDGRQQYFSPDGRNMKKAFLRAPVKFSAVTSGFNPRRRHPITKRVTAHRGVDYRAPVGADVVTVGDGTVTKAAYDKLNGHHVFVRHVTKYLHFKKRAVKRGQKVRQGQVIGYLGSSGRVTGPHLHFEFVVNGVHRNPRTVKLPAAKPLPKAQIEAFQASTASMLARLETLEQTRLAALD